MNVKGTDEVIALVVNTKSGRPGAGDDSQFPYRYWELYDLTASKRG